MKVTDKNVKLLLEKYREISLLGNINAVLSYDTNVSLPEKGSEGRAKQSAYITKLISDKWLDNDFREIVEKVENGDLNEDEKAIVRNVRHAGKFYFSVPQKTIIEFSEVTSTAFMAWQKARQANSFKNFLPHLTNVINLSIQIAEHMGYTENRYDALLDLYEPDLTSREFQKIVDVVQPTLTKLLQKITKSDTFKGLSFKDSEFSIVDQERLTHFVLGKMVYDFDSGRQDVSAHPFTETLGAHDIRITNRYKKNSFVESIMIAMHEGGHALYEQGIAEAYSGTPLEGGVSLGIHESQSRFWENQVGRSREFVEYMEPILKATYPAELSSISSDDLFKMFNAVAPGFIRVEADEVTYNLHIMLRFEIERDLINQRIKSKDIPEVWREKMKKYLGITPKSDAEGCLQDVHWSYGSFGYFPTYTLGNLYSAQFTKAMKREIQLDDQILLGDFEPILVWLREKIHVHGARYLPHELCIMITGEDLNPLYFIDYLEDKYSKIYK